MFRRIMSHGRRRLVMVVIVGGIAISTLMLILAWPGVQRRYAVGILLSAVRAEESDLHSSIALSSAIQQVIYYRAQDEAVASIIPILDWKDERICKRAMYCILELDRNSAEVLTSLITIYHNPLASSRLRIDIAGMLTRLDSSTAAECGAAATWHRFVARHPDLISGEDADLLEDEG